MNRFSALILYGHLLLQVGFQAVFFMVFHGSRLGFQGSRWDFMVIQGSWVVFQGSRFSWFLMVLGQFFFYSFQGFRSLFHDSGLVFYGSRLVYIRAERRRREVRR